MKVFVTGASGFIGSAVVQALIEAKHEVIGLARNEESAAKIRSAGADVLMGSLEDLNSLREGALRADGIIHTAFIHDFTQYAKANDVEKAVIDVMGEALKGTGKPLVVAAGLLGLPPINGVITEDSVSTNPVRSSEVTAMKWASEGVHASVVRLPPSVHDKGDKGFMPFIIQQARKHKVSAYPGDGTTQWAAVHRLDAAKVFQRAMEKSIRGARYNAVGDSGVALKDIATLIGKQLNLPVASVTGEEITKHFEWMSHFISLDGRATAVRTQEQLNWKPAHMGLLDDLRKNYF